MLYVFSNSNENNYVYSIIFINIKYGKVILNLFY
jgi:hypothetical protein